MVWGQEEEIARKIEAISEQATEAYKAGEYKKALDLFKQAYDMEAIPTLLYNIGRCHERLEEHKEAKTYYELFLLEADPDSEIKGKVEERMKTVEVKIRQEELAAQKASEPVEKVPENEAEPAPSRVLDYVVLGSGLALLATGGTFAFLANSELQTFEDTGASFEARRDAKESGETLALVADVTMITGALVTGLGVWMLLGSQEAPPQERVDLTPWFGRDQAGVSMQTRF